MYVDINPIKWNGEVHHVCRMPACRDQIGISLADHLTYQTITNHPTINKEILLIGLGAVCFNASQLAMDLDDIKLLFKSHGAFYKSLPTNFTDARQTLCLTLGNRQIQLALTV